jgi:hypothetical protein
VSKEGSESQYLSRTCGGEIGLERAVSEGELFFELVLQSAAAHLARLGDEQHVVEEEHVTGHLLLLGIDEVQRTLGLVAAVRSCDGHLLSRLAVALAVHEQLLYLQHHLIAVALSLLFVDHIGGVLCLTRVSEGHQQTFATALTLIFCAADSSSSSYEIELPDLVNSSNSST